MAIPRPRLLRLGANPVVVAGDMGLTWIFCLIPLLLLFISTAGAACASLPLALVAGAAAGQPFLAPSGPTS